MTVKKDKRLSQIARELNVGLSHLSEFLNKKGYDVIARPNAKVTYECYILLLDKFSSDKFAKEESDELNRQKTALKESLEATTEEDAVDVLTEEIQEDIVIEEIQEEAKEEIIKPVKKEEEVSIEKDIETIESLEKVNEVIEEQTTKEDNILTETANTDNLTEPKDTKVTDTDELMIDEILTDEEVADEIVIEDETEKVSDSDSKLKIIKTINLDSINQKTRPERKKTRVERRKERRDKEKASIDAIDKAKVVRQQEEADIKIRLEEERKKDEIEKAKKIEEENFIETKITKLSGPTVVGKIELKEEKKEKKKETGKDKTESSSSKTRKRKRRKRIRKTVETDAKTQKTTPVTKKKVIKKKKRTVEIDDEDVKKQVRETLAKLTDKKKKKGVKHRKKKREVTRQKIQEESERQEQEQKILSVTEFIPANEFATMMDVSINEVIKTCFELGKMVTINTRLDADLLSIVAEEYGYAIEFVSATENNEIEEYVDADEELIPRPPIVTVMGHVDHGKTSLLDFIRDTNVIAGEAGGITQHIGAYNVTLENGQSITFLDTPGHEAFTAMRARGAKVTDLAIIIVAADDNIMPQTDEAISHAKAADVPIIFAINKIDKAGADPERIKKELADRNMLIEEWGGEYQSKEISAKNGTNIKELLEEVTIAAEVLDLKANPTRPAKGTIIEATLDKGRGYIATILVQTGTLKIGDVVFAGAHSGKVKAMYNERDQRVEEAGPSEPVLILGLDGAPQAGDIFNVLSSEKEARDLANRHKRLQREQSLRSRRHITLDEIGRRLKIGNFQELNIIIKGDVIGSIEAIADSFSKLSTEEIQIKVMHKGVGPISEADVVLAAASDAVIIGFQVRPGLAAKKLAEKEEIEIRLYSVIYDAINELKAAMEGMLSPEIKEEITATVEIREVFKITKVGKVAGCFVLDGKINKESKVRLIREGIVVYSGVLGSLKRYKDEVKEVHSGMECGLNIEKYDDIKVGDIVEAYRETEIARTL